MLFIKQFFMFAVLLIFQMKTFTLKSELISYLNGIRKDKIVSFIPTMGCLHKGHITLIEKAKENSDLVICSIFVNPTQFNNSKDLKNYPQTIKSDFDNKTLPLMISMIDMICEEKPLKVNWKNFK